MRELLAGFGSEQVRSPHIPDEYEISREQHPRNIATAAVVEQRPRDMLRRVPRCVKRPHPQTAHRDFFAIGDHMVGVRRRPVRAAHARRMHLHGITKPSLQLRRPDDEVGMHVRLEDMANLQIVLTGVANEIVHVSRGVNHRRLAGTFIAHKIRRDGKSGNESLIEQHG